MPLVRVPEQVADALVGHADGRRGRLHMRRVEDLWVQRLREVDDAVFLQLSDKTGKVIRKERVWASGHAPSP